MSEGQTGRLIDVYETCRFSKALVKLPHDLLKVVEDAIDVIILDPIIDEQKMGIQISFESINFP